MFIVEGYVIVSADGMLADAAGVMPQSLQFPADKAFFEAALDEADLVVHGRHSHEEQTRSAQRPRIVLTRAVPALAPDTRWPNSTLWNPAGAPFEQAVARAGIGASGRIAVIGGPAVYALFLDRYDTFWLSQAHHTTLANGHGVFPDVPAHTPQEVLARHGLQAGETRILDAAENVDLTAWRRGSS